MSGSRRQFLSSSASFLCGGLLAPSLLSPALAQALRHAGGFVSILEFGAKGDGIHDDQPAFSKALASGYPIYLPAGKYFLSDHVKPPTGANVILLGAHRDLVSVITTPNRVCIFCDASPGIDNRISGAHIEGITFDGRHIRQAFPYIDATERTAKASMSQALNLRGPKSADDAHVTITRCRFRDINGLPVWIADFSGSVEFSHNHLSRCRDPGFLLNDNLKVFNNTIEYSGDNGLSISRSNRRITVYGNHIRESAVAGIFVGGVNLAQKGSEVVLSGAYLPGHPLTLSSSSKPFSTETIGFNITLRKNDDALVLRCTGIISASTATVIALSEVPESIRNQSVRDWSIGPIAGAQYGQIYANVIEGSLAHGINLNQGCKGLNIHDNTILRTGICADSERVSTGSIRAGQDELLLDDVRGFSSGDWIVIEPDYTAENAFASRITHIAGNTLTLASAPHENYILERVRRAGTSHGRFGICVVGNYISPTYREYAEELNIHDNTILDFLSGAIRLGSSSGAVRRVVAHHNSLRALEKNAGNSTPAILVDDGQRKDMPATNVFITDNTIELDEGAPIFASKLAGEAGSSKIVFERNRQLTRQ